MIQEKIEKNIGRVIQEQKTNYIVYFNNQEYFAVVRGKFHDDSQKEKIFPKVGDYVEFEIVSDQLIIENILPRRNEIKRKSAHDDSVQVLVANVDFVFIVMGLDNDYNLNRLERYILLSNQNDVKPLVILNKKDLIDNNQLIEKEQEILKRIGDVPVHSISAEENIDLDIFYDYLSQDKTGVLLGSSGAGKSTITNNLLKLQEQKTNDVRYDDSKGRHTTTSRQLFSLPKGGYLIDTPGMRELGFSKDQEVKKEDTFQEIETIALNCKYRKCDHQKTEGCAVLVAIENNQISQKQFDNYLKIKKEQEFFNSKLDPQIEKEYKNRQKKLHKKNIKIQKNKYLGR